MTRSQLHNRLLFKRTATAMLGHGTQLCGGFNVDWIYETVLYWLWMNRQYVGIGACLNLIVSCVIAWCTMHHNTSTIAHLVAIQTRYNGYDGT